MLTKIEELNKKIESIAEIDRKIKEVKNKPMPPKGACIKLNRFVSGKPFSTKQFSELRRTNDIYYMSRDDLEDMDMFDEPQGWYVTSEGFRKAVKWGIPVETPETVDNYRNLTNLRRIKAATYTSIADDIFSICSREGKYPFEENQIVLQGDVIQDPLNPQNIYGGGRWWVIEPNGSRADRGIWCVENNGMDGDNWARNNIRTGGAGAIGYKIPYNETLEKIIRKIGSWKPKSVL